MMPVGIAIWFGFSVIYEIAIPLVLQRWLKQQRITIPLWKRGTIGVSEWAYVNWCKHNQRPVKGFVLLRSILAINTICAVMAFMLFCGTLDKSVHRWNTLTSTTYPTTH
jgi:hypothetical protein